MTFLASAIVAGTLGMRQSGLAADIDLSTWTCKEFPSSATGPVTAAVTSA